MNRGEERNSVESSDQRIPAHLREQGQRVRLHAGVRHPFLRMFANGETNSRADGCVFLEFYYFIHKLPFYMAGLASNSCDEHVMSIVSRILFEEMGGKSHPDSVNTKGPHLVLYRRFMLDVFGISTVALQDYKPAVSTKNLDTKINDLYCGKNTNKALGALFTIETMSDEMISKLTDGLRTRGLRDEAIEFFTLHWTLEKEHAELSEAASIPRLHAGPASQSEFVEGSDMLLESLKQFWDGIAAIVSSAP